MAAFRFLEKKNWKNIYSLLQDVFTHSRQDVAQGQGDNDILGRSDSIPGGEEPAILLLELGELIQIFIHPQNIDGEASRKTKRGAYQA